MEIPTRLFNSALMLAPQAVDEILAKQCSAPAAKTSGTETSGVVDGKYAGKIRALAYLENEDLFADAGYAIIDGVALTVDFWRADLSRIQLVDHVISGYPRLFPGGDC